MRGKWFSLGTYQASFRLDERSILSVHLVVESAGVAEVVASAVSSPQGCWCCAAVYALATLYRCCTVKNDKPSLISRTFLRVSSTSNKEATRSVTSIERETRILLFDLYNKHSYRLCFFVSRELDLDIIVRSGVYFVKLEHADSSKWSNRIDENLNLVNLEIVARYDRRLFFDEAARPTRWTPKVTKIGGDGSDMQLQTYHIKRLPEQKQSLF